MFFPFSLRAALVLLTLGCGTLPAVACAPVDMVEISRDFRSAVALATRDRPASEAEHAVIFKLAQAFGLPSPV